MPAPVILSGPYRRPLACRIGSWVLAIVSTLAALGLSLWLWIRFIRWAAS